MRGCRVFHICSLFATAININILICNSGNSLAGKINGGKKKRAKLQCTELHASAVPIKETINLVTFS
jgi:hypothetical protein